MLEMVNALTVEDWYMFKTMREQGMSISEISRRIGVSRKTERKYIAMEKPSKYSREGDSLSLPLTPWESTKLGHSKTPSERWQSDILYVKIQGRFFFLIIFIDEYSRYIVHHSLLTSKYADSVSLEAQTAIERLRKDSIADPVMQINNGSSFIAMEFRIVLRENHLTQKLIRPHTPEQNGIVERANKTMRESLVPVILTDYEQAKHELFKIVEYYNNRRRHSSLNYLTPIQYYMGDPDVLLAVRKTKIEKANPIRREKNMLKGNGGETAGVAP